MPERISLDPNSLLGAYTQGAFPMADPDGTIRWYTADPRGIIPLDDFHVPGTLRQLCRQKRFDIRFNTRFDEVMRQCMLTRESSWITEALVSAYRELHRLGFAHSVEAWEAGELAGGLYGVAIGGAFFGESMFHHRRDASKVALVALVERLRDRQFQLLDTQATTPHLKRFGCIEIPASDYLARLRHALKRNCTFD